MLEVDSLGEVEEKTGCGCSWNNKSQKQTCASPGVVLLTEVGQRWRSLAQRMCKESRNLKSNMDFKVTKNYGKGQDRGEGTRVSGESFRERTDPVSPSAESAGASAEQQVPVGEGSERVRKRPADRKADAPPPSLRTIGRTVSS